MDQEVTFSLSYEQLTRVAEKISVNAGWTARTRFTSANRVRPQPFRNSGMNWLLMVRHRTITNKPTRSLTPISSV